MKSKNKLKVVAVLMFLTASLYSQSDSLGMPGDNLNLSAVLSIFKQSSSIEDFEKRLNSADSKVNNLDLNGDNQVDYLRVVDYGKDDFHSIVIQDPVSKSESQDVAVIEVVKKDNNTAHIQIVGDETLYGKDYIIEPENQAPLNSTASKKSKATNDDVYETDNSTAHVMINVWAWPSVGYIYSPGYSYWSSPWYYGYYPGWYSPWRPYGWRVYRSGFYGYNYGFYGYRRYHHAFPHVHNYYYGKRSSSGYVKKTAPHYGRRDGVSNQSRNREAQGNNKKETQQNNNTRRDGNATRNEKNNGSQRKTSTNQNRSQDNNAGKKDNTRTRQNTNEKSRNTDQRKSGQNRSQGSGGSKVNSTPKSGGGAGRSGGGGGRSSSGGGRSGNR